MADLSRITTVQLEAINDRINTEWATMYVHMGRDGTEAAPSQSALIDPSDEARVVATVTQPTAVQVQGVGDITVTVSETIKEYGAFSSAGTGTPPTGGTMYARANVLAGQAVLINDIVRVTFLTSLAQA